MNKTFFKLLVLTISCLFFTLSSISCTAKSSPHDLKWHSFEKAIKLAQKENKPILIDFYADWCGWCYELDEKTFNAPEVKEYLKENYILVRLNADNRFRTIKFRNQLFSPQDLLRVYGITGLPAVVFLAPNGDFVYMQPGFQPKEFYARLLKDIREAIEKVQNERKQGIQESPVPIPGF